MDVSTKDFTSNETKKEFETITWQTTKCPLRAVLAFLRISFSPSA